MLSINDPKQKGNEMKHTEQITGLVQFATNISWPLVLLIGLNDCLMLLFGLVPYNINMESPCTEDDLLKKVKVGDDQEMMVSDRYSHSKNRDGKTY